MILHNRNLVSLLGYCDDGDHKALIYEHMANGSLQQHLLDTNTKTLSWMERLQIAVDAAQGLEYLHNGCKPPIIHRDLKPANILLDKTMQAKIADFGLSRTLATENQSQLFTRLAGTLGYLDPGTRTCGNVNKQSDLYSFDVILLELITGHPAITRSSQGNFHILNWVEPTIRTGDIQHNVDLKLRGEFNQNSAWKILELAISCTQPTALQRPDTSHVLGELKECLAVHQRTSTQTPIMSTIILSESEIAPSPRFQISVNYWWPATIV